MGALIDKFSGGVEITNYPEMVPNHTKISFGTHDIYDKRVQTLQKYCKCLVGLGFYGVKSPVKVTDYNDINDVCNLGHTLKELDKYLRSRQCTQDFFGTEERFLEMIKTIANNRRNEFETPEECWFRLTEESIRFSEVYRMRSMESEALTEDHYWGCHQQLLAGKVIADWVDHENGPLDPIFGVLLSPVAGRVGPGNAQIVHNMLFDGTGYMAYHSAVHDGFGYLHTIHNIGPGYGYLHGRRKKNVFSGQMTGIRFWKKTVKNVVSQQKFLLTLTRKC